KSILDKSSINSSRICQVSSKADKQTGWPDIIAHAEIARKQHWEVKEVILDDTAHYNHLKKDHQMYDDLVTPM
ncbi:hypothetical protein GQ44DRAFT_603259, partial [Phaeosphaeriaceae sp. PMI808]